MSRHYQDITRDLRDADYVIRQGYPELAVETLQCALASARYLPRNTKTLALRAYIVTAIEALNHDA